MTCVLHATSDLFNVSFCFDISVFIVQFVSSAHIDCDRISNTTEWCRNIYTDKQVGESCEVQYEDWLSMCEWITFPCAVSMPRFLLFAVKISILFSLQICGFICFSNRNRGTWTYEHTMWYCALYVFFEQPAPLRLVLVHVTLTNFHSI